MAKKKKTLPKNFDKLIEKEKVILKDEITLMKDEIKLLKSALEFKEEEKQHYSHYS